MGERKTGRENKLYYNSNTHASPTWVLIANAIDVDDNIVRGEPDISARSSAFGMIGAGLKRITINFGYRTQAGTDTVWDVIRALAWTDDPTPKEFFVANQLAATSGSEGIRAYCLCTELGDEQPLEDGQQSPVTLKNTYFLESAALVEPDWYVVT